MPRLPYPDPPLADDLVTLRPWADRDVAAAMEAKGVGEDAARAWIATCGRRRTDGAGLALAIADAGTGRGAWHRRPAVYAHAASIETAREASPRRRARSALDAASLSRVEALVEVQNVASQRVLERAGFTQEGRLRAYVATAEGRADAFIFARLR